ncbi:MAG: DUF1007 family protein [Spirochaeta sp.]
MRRLFCFVAVLLVGGVQVGAHPHVFIDATASVEFQDSTPVAVHVRWSFDDFFSRTILLDFADGSRGPLSSGQVENIRSMAFENLSNYNYFTHILVDGREVVITRVEDFLAEVDGRSLIYSFRVPLAQPDGVAESELSQVREVVVGMYDDSYYSHFDYQDQPISFTGEDPDGVRVEKRERPDRRYYFDLMVPEMFHINWD